MDGKNNIMEKTDIIEELQKVSNHIEPLLIVLGKKNTMLFLDILEDGTHSMFKYPLNSMWEGIPVLGLDSFEGIETY